MTDQKHCKFCGESEDIQMCPRCKNGACNSCMTFCECCQAALFCDRCMTRADEKPGEGNACDSCIEYAQSQF